MMEEEELTYDVCLIRDTGPSIYGVRTEEGGVEKNTPNLRTNII